MTRARSGEGAAGRAGSRRAGGHGGRSRGGWGVGVRSRRRRARRAAAGAGSAKRGRAASAWVGQVDGDVERDAAVGEDDDPVGERDRLVDVVGDEHDGRAVPLVQLLQQPVHADAGQGVEGAERLVEQQQLRLAHEGPGQGDALGLAARQRARPRPGLVGQPDLLEGGAGRGGGADDGRPMITLRSTRCHGSRRGSWNTTARRSGTRTRPSTSASRAPRTRSSVDLPEPLRPSRATNSPGADVQVEAVEHDVVAERLAQAVDDDGAAVGRRVRRTSATVIGPPPRQQPGLEEPHEGVRAAGPSVA